VGFNTTGEFIYSLKCVSTKCKYNLICYNLAGHWRNQLAICNDRCNKRMVLSASYRDRSHSLCCFLVSILLVCTHNTTCIPITILSLLPVVLWHIQTYENTQVMMWSWSAKLPKGSSYLSNLNLKMYMLIFKLTLMVIITALKIYK